MLIQTIETPKSFERYKQLGRLDMFDLPDLKHVRPFEWEVEWS